MSDKVSAFAAYVVTEEENGTFSGDTRDKAIGEAMVSILENTGGGWSDPGVWDVVLYEQATWCGGDPDCSCDNPEDGHGDWDELMVSFEKRSTVRIEVYATGHVDDYEWREVTV